MTAKQTHMTDNIALCGDPSPLCMKEVMGKTWPHLKRCMRPLHHDGRCKPIENGMTSAEAQLISEGY